MMFDHHPCVGDIYNVLFTVHVIDSLTTIVIVTIIKWMIEIITAIKLHVLLKGHTRRKQLKTEFFSHRFIKKLLLLNAVKNE